jgi:hypothetical protein
MLRQFFTVSLSSTLLALGFGLPSFAQTELTFEGTCKLSFQNEVVGEGECTAVQSNDIVTVKATVSENNQKYTAIINNDKNSGLLIGAGTFPLANGELVSNEATKVIFPNSYILEINVQ